MAYSDPPPSRYGRDRACPHCGTRVAQKARTCFFCGASLEERPRRKRAVPWADIVLFAVIGGVVVFWWTRRPETANEPLVSLAERPTALLAEGGTPAASVVVLGTQATTEPLVSPTSAL